MKIESYTVQCKLPESTMEFFNFIHTHEELAYRELKKKKGFWGFISLPYNRGEYILTGRYRREMEVVVGVRVDVATLDNLLTFTSSAEIKESGND